jgi:hypothetical protein
MPPRGSPRLNLLRASANRLRNYRDMPGSRPGRCRSDSPPARTRFGTAAVSWRNATAAGVLSATITSGSRPGSSFACVRIRFKTPPVPKRNTDDDIAPFRPSKFGKGLPERQCTQRCFRIGFLGHHHADAPRPLVLRVRASGHAAALPMSVMKSRRVIRSPRRLAAASKSVRRHQAPWLF